MNDFSKRFIHLLDIRGKTASEVSKVTKINASDLSSYKSGKYKPSAKSIMLLASALRTTPEYLMGLTDDPDAKAPSRLDDAIAETYSRLSAEGKRQAEAYLRFLLSQEGKDKG